LAAPFYERIDASATPEQKELLKTLSPNQIGMTALAGELIRALPPRATAFRSVEPR
jgi:phosphoglucomutase